MGRGNRMAGILAACAAERSDRRRICRIHRMSHRRTLFRAFSRGRSGRHRGAGVSLRRPCAGAQQLREPGLPDRHRGRAIRWSPSSTGPAAGAMPPSARSTPSPPSWPPRRYRWWRRCRSGGESLHFHQGFRYAVFPRRGGRWPELGTATSGNGWGGFWAASTRSVVRRAFTSAPRSACEELGRRCARFRARTATGCPIIWPTNTPSSPTTLLDGGGGARAAVGAAHERRAHSRGLPPRQYSVDRRGPAFRRSGRLRDRPRDPGPVDAARGQPSGNAPWSSSILLKGYEQFLPFDRREIGADRAAARAAHDPLFGVAGAALARSGFSQGFSVVCRTALLGGALPRAEDQLAAVLEPPLEL